jgi:hypothetical protein
MLKVSSGPTRGRTPAERWRDRPSSTARRKASSACLCRSLTLASCLFRAARDMTRDCGEYQVSMVIGIRPCGSGGGWWVVRPRVHAVVWCGGVWRRVAVADSCYGRLICLSTDAAARMGYFAIWPSLQCSSPSSAPLSWPGHSATCKICFTNGI